MEKRSGGKIRILARISFPILVKVPRTTNFHHREEHFALEYALKLARSPFQVTRGSLRRIPSQHHFFGPVSSCERNLGSRMGSADTVFENVHTRLALKVPIDNHTMVIYSTLRAVRIPAGYHQIWLLTHFSSLSPNPLLHH